MLHVYGIVDRSCFNPLPGEGHDGGDVFPMACASFAAAVSVTTARTIEASPPNLWRHERVLERLMQDHAVLPLRFGTICPDAAMLREALLPWADALTGALARVHGKVEMALRIRPEGGIGGSGDTGPECTRGPRWQAMTARPEVAEPGFSASGKDGPSGPGAVYLRAKLQGLLAERAREASGAGLRQLLLSAVEHIASEVIWSAAKDGVTEFQASCLVPQGRIAAFVDALDCLRSGRPGLTVTCTGPWAPYSFGPGPSRERQLP